mmetsp:Transcript_59481/g.106105  ORF Transcript_59481/g.106105 Transcript_59481/m.106105 type:complete len:209 (-) Transcript_59481:598-1224(-)
MEGVCPAMQQAMRSTNPKAFSISKAPPDGLLALTSAALKSGLRELTDLTGLRVGALGGSSSGSLSGHTSRTTLPPVCDNIGEGLTVASTSSISLISRADVSGSILPSTLGCRGCEGLDTRTKCMTTPTDPTRHPTKECHGMGAVYALQRVRVRVPQYPSTQTKDAAWKRCWKLRMAIRQPRASGPLHRSRNGNHRVLAFVHHSCPTRS